MNLGSLSISLKVFSIILVLGGAMIGVASTAIQALGSLHSVTVELEIAGAEAMESGRLTQLTTSLNRAEFRIAADPSRENVADFKAVIERQRVDFESRLAAAKGTAGDRRLALLENVEGRYTKYLDGLRTTLDLADSVGSQVEIGGGQRRIVDAVRENREEARALNDVIGDYINFADRRIAELTASAATELEAAAQTLNVTL